MPLCDAIRRGADLRIYTELLFNEHIDTSSDCGEVVSEENTERLLTFERFHSRFGLR